jgi:hypothetical protein
MAFTSPAVSSQDAAPITPETTTGASLLSKEKPLDASPGIPNTIRATEPPPVFPTAPTTIPDLRTPDTQAGSLPLGPQPTTSELSHTASEGGPSATRAEAIERPAEEQKLAGQAIPGALDITQSAALEEEGIPASQAERETFGYWRSGRSQAKRALGGLEATVGSLKEEEDVIGRKSLVDPEKITYFRQGRVADPAKYAPAALAALPDLLTSQAKAVGDKAKNVAQVLGEDLDGGKALIEPDKITYWSHGRVADPAKYASAGLATLSSAAENEAKAIRDRLGNAFDFAKEEVDGGKALIEPDKITYWSHGRVSEPAKYAPAALAALSNALKDVGLGIVNTPIRPDTLLASPPAGFAPPVPPRKAARTYSQSEYSDYRSSTMSFHSSHATLSSGQRRPQPEVRNAFSSPYL